MKGEKGMPKKKENNYCFECIGTVSWRNATLL